MTDQTIHYFIDTNVLTQCSALDQLDWRALTDAGNIQLIISRAVQSEIDNQKNNGGSRVAKRARTASSLIRQVILSETGSIDIRTDDPSVQLTVYPSLQPDPALSSQLDYTRADDRLVGIAYAYQQAHSGRDVRVLTHDTGPLATGKMVDASVDVVPDEWLLPPERSETDRKLRHLENEISKLKNREPAFSIDCVDEDENSVERLDFEIVLYDAMTDSEISVIMDRLQQRFPKATDFGPTQSAHRTFAGIADVMRSMETYNPPTKQQIAKYEAAHKAWLEECETMLGNLHETARHRNASPEFVFSIRNEGTRPANDALVTFEARGSIKVSPPPYRDVDDETPDETTPDGLQLPKPPKPPEGKWVSTVLGGLSALEALQNFQHNSALISDAPFIGAGLLERAQRPEKDQNSFYYKPKRSSIPAESFGLECKQWRHGIDAECFQGLIHIDDTENDISGAIKCTIHAENLTHPCAKIVPVQVSIRRERATRLAEQMMNVLLG